MRNDRAKERRADHRALRPTLDGRLEPRCLLSRGGAGHALIHPGSAVHGHGRSALVTDSDGEQYKITVTDGVFTAVGPTLRVKALRNGQFDINVFGSTSLTTLEITPIPRPQKVHNPGRFPVNSIAHDGLLHIRSITVKTGRIGQILAYRTADLSGTIAQSVTKGVVTPLDTTPIERIAVFGINPGGQIATSGDLNTLNVYNNLDLANGSKILIGRDLNWMSVGNDLTIQGGSTFAVGRDVGATREPAKGTDPGGQGIKIQGNLIVTPDSRMIVGRQLNPNNFEVQGTAIGQITVDGTTIPFNS